MAKPKIFGHCAAGCDWETVHKEDFDRLASMSTQIATPEQKSILPGAGFYHMAFRTTNGTRLNFGLVYWDGYHAVDTTAVVYNDTSGATTERLTILETGEVQCRKQSDGGTTYEIDSDGYVTFAKMDKKELPASAEGVGF